MSDVESIIVAFPPDLCDAFRAKAVESGIDLLPRDDWKLLKDAIKKCGAIGKGEVREFTIHLRILADLYLSRTMGESNFPGFVEQCKTAKESLQEARTLAKKLDQKLASESVKAVMPPNNNLKSELSKTIETLEAAIARFRIPKSSRNPTRHGDHALANNFEALWECYTGTKLKGNRTAYSIAKMYFRCAGYQPRTKKTKKGDPEELVDIGQKFDRARLYMKNRGLMTPARKLTSQELSNLSYLAF